MSTVVTMTGGPSAGSGAAALLSVVTHRIGHSGHAAVQLEPGDVPAALRGGDLAAAVAMVRAADGVVLIRPVPPAGDAGVLEGVDHLPLSALRGKSVLSVLTGSCAVDAPAALDAVRSVLSGLGAHSFGKGCFVPDADIRTYPGGGVVLAAAPALDIAETVDAFLAVLDRAPAAVAPRPAGRRVSPVAGAPDLTVARADVDDPVLAPLLRELMIEYSTRYGGPSPYTTLTEVPASDFSAPDGVFLALIEHGETIAGGALRRYDGQTAEVKRVWTSARHRRRGLALRLMAELESADLESGYRRIHLTTGGRQPEAVGLYLAAGYLPRFDLTADPGDAGPLAFGKELVPGAGLVDWREPAAGEYDRVAERLPAAVSAE